MHQGFPAFDVLGMNRNTGHRADLHALGFVEMADAFGAFGWVDLIDFRPEEDGLIRALRFAHIAVDALIGNH